MINKKKDNFIKFIEVVTDRMNAKMTNRAEQPIYDDYFKYRWLPPFAKSFANIMNMPVEPIIEYLYPTMKPTIKTPADLYDSIMKVQKPKLVNQ